MEKFIPEQFHNRKLEQKNEDNAGRRRFLGSIMEPFKKFAQEVTREPKENENTPLISQGSKTYSRREFIGESARGVAALAAVQTFEKLQRFLGGGLEAFAEQQTEQFSDEKWEQFFVWCHERINELDKKGTKKTDALVLEWADFYTEVVVTIEANISSRQAKKFESEIDYISQRLNDIIEDTDWDIDPENELREIANIPEYLKDLKAYGRVIAVERAQKETALKLSLIHFGDYHEWDPSAKRHNRTTTGHNQMVEMFGKLIGDGFAFVGYEGIPEDIEKTKRRKETHIKEQRENLRKYGSKWGEPTKQRIEKGIEEHQEKLDHAANFVIHKTYPAVTIASIDTYARDNKIDHEEYRIKRDEAEKAFHAARGNYYNIKRGYIKGDINKVALDVIEKERALSQLNKMMFDERSQHACRTMISQMLVSGDLRGVVIFGLADGKYFRKQVRRINENPESYLVALKKDNLDLYNQVVSKYSLNQLQDLAVDLYTVIPNAFIPSHLKR